MALNPPSAIKMNSLITTAAFIFFQKAYPQKRIKSFSLCLPPAYTPTPNKLL